jgi:hypothetical protein
MVPDDEITWLKNHRRNGRTESEPKVWRKLAGGEETPVVIRRRFLRARRARVSLARESLNGFKGTLTSH